MPAETTDRVQPAPQPARPENAIQQAAMNAWAPRPTLFKLGAVCNETYNQSLATQYDDLPKCTIIGIESGVKSVLKMGLFAVEAGTDASSVIAKDLQIGSEAISYPALAEVHSDELAQNLRQLGSKYGSVFEPLKQGYENVQKDLVDIGAQSNADSTAYTRLLTDPANAIASGVDKFTIQKPGAQVEAIFEQTTQIVAFGFAEKALASGAASLSTTQLSAKFDELLVKMDAELARAKNSLSAPELQPAGMPAGWSANETQSAASESCAAMSTDKGFRGDHDPWAPRNSKTGKLKSYINADGDLTPPDPQGLFKKEPVDTVQHLCGSFYKYHKEHSPFTSLSETGEIIEKYGERYKITVDLSALEKAIAAGEVHDVAIIPHEKVLQMIDQSKCADYSKTRARFYAARDKEILIRGVIPERFFTVEDVSK